MGQLLYGGCCKLEVVYICNAIVVNCVATSQQNY